MIAECGTIGFVEQRAGAASTITADTQSRRILLNIVRCANAAPQNFVSLTSLTDHITSSASTGLLGVGQTPAQKLFIFGPNEVSGSEATDFDISVLDDPGSIAARSKPASVATLG